MASGGNTRQTLPDGERRAARVMMQALEPFRELRADMPLQYVRSFLLVCEEEGLGPTEYAQRAGTSQSVMSRHLLDIGDRNRHMAPGFGLVTQRQDPLELRKHQVLLTPKGRAAMHRLKRALENLNAND